MPTRYLKESICTSDNLARLSAEAERFWYRLLVKVDDFGLCDARIPVLRAWCLPLLLDRVTEEDVEGWLAELQQAKLIMTYTVDGRPYLKVITFCKHNNPRAQHSKYPSPPEDAGNCLQVQESVAESESKSISISESESESKRGATPNPVSKQVEVYLANGGRFPSGSLADGTTKREGAIQFITEHVKDDPASLELWGRVVAGYCAQWSGVAYKIMVNDYYLAGRIPGERNSENGTNTHQQTALAVLKGNESRRYHKQSDNDLAVAQAEWDAAARAASVESG